MLAEQAMEAVGTVPVAMAATVSAVAATAEVSQQAAVATMAMVGSELVVMALEAVSVMAMIL